MDATQLDAVLTVQLTMAWAGERSDPPRLGWWNCDVIELEGGGELLQRLFPRTHAWVRFAGAREAARRTEQTAREKAGIPSHARTLFGLGATVDAALENRLRWHKLQQHSVDTLLLPCVGESFSVEALRAAFAKDGATPRFETTEAGRELRSEESSEVISVVRALAQVLLAGEKIADRYPLAYVVGRETTISAP